MRKRILFICIVCCIAWQTNAQVANNTIVNDNSTWATLFYTCFDNVNTTIVEAWTDYYFFAGDSIFNEKIYKKIFYYSDEQHTKRFFAGLMREDNLKTYFIKPGTIFEKTLYDFSLETGDVFEYDDFTVYVLQSDSILINNVLKKRLIIVPELHRDWEIDTIIENIGCLRGLLYPLCYMCNGGFSELLCYTQNDELIYRNPKRSKCYYDNPKELPSVQTITPGKTWYIESGYACPAGDETGCFCYYGLQTIKVGSAKTFNGKEYYELLTDDMNQQWNVVTYVREEGGKVFFYAESCDKEYLMYDFNLNMDDEVVLADPHYPISLFNCKFAGYDFQYKVIEVDSIEYNQVKRKRLKLMNIYFPSCYDTWVEGIGCMQGIDNPAASLRVGGVNQLKDCYESDKLIFVNENPKFCWVPTTVNNVYQDWINIFIDKSNILHIVNAKDIPLTIYDIQGRKVQSVFPNNDDYQINISFLSKGLYIVSDRIRNIKFKIAIK